MGFGNGACEEVDEVLEETDGEKEEGLEGLEDDGHWEPMEEVRVL